MTITLRINPDTGKKDIVVKLSSDDDALPQEHESMHRALVEKLLGKGILQAHEAGEVVVTRDSQHGEAESAPHLGQKSQAPQQGLSEDA